MHQLCEQIWDLVSPVLTHDSPEGTVLDASPNSSALRESAAQDLLSSSWRSLKEASALLGTVLSSPTSTFEDYESAGALFMEWLTRIRHRGAFSAVMPAFENLCAECLKDTSKNLKFLPPKWLEVRHIFLSVLTAGMPFLNEDGQICHPSVRGIANVDRCYPYF